MRYTRGALLSAIDNEKDFARFVRQHESALRQYLGHRIRSPELRAEVYAAVVLAAERDFEVLNRLPPERARRWLIQVAANKRIDAFRSEARQQRLVERIEIVTVPETPPTPEELAVRGESTAEAAHRVRVVLSGLPRRHRQFIVLDAFHRLTSAEIALDLNITPTAARLRLMRARRAFAKKYIALYGPELP